MDLVNIKKIILMLNVTSNIKQKPMSLKNESWERYICIMDMDKRLLQAQ